MVLAGMGIFAGATWARIVGILVASVNLMFQFAYLGHYPFWSFTMIVIDILIIYGLAGHSTEERSNKSDRRSGMCVGLHPRRRSPDIGPA